MGGGMDYNQAAGMMGGWQLGLLGSLAPVPAAPVQAEAPLNVNEKAKPVYVAPPKVNEPIIYDKLRPDPLLNKRIPVPEWPPNLLRADVGKDDLVYNLRHMNA